MSGEQYCTIYESELYKFGVQRRRGQGRRPPPRKSERNLAATLTRLRGALQQVTRAEEKQPFLPDRVRERRLVISIRKFEKFGKAAADL